MVCHRRGPAGFTLIELLIVIAVMVILAGLVLPNADPSIHDQLRSASQIIAGDLAYGRNLAVTNNSTYRFTFEPRNNRYVLTHSADDKPELDTLPSSPSGSPDDPPDQQIVDLEELPHLGPTVQIVAVGVKGNPWVRVDNLEFGPLGETEEETAIWLSAGRGSSTRFIKLHVNPITGLVHVEPFSAKGPPAEIIPAG